METEWLRDELLAGLQRIYCLGMERTPAAEILPGTAEAWCAAVSHGRVFDRDLDAERIRAAFVTLASTRTSWPAPTHLMDAMPPRDQLALPPARDPNDPYEVAHQRRLAEYRGA